MPGNIYPLVMTDWGDKYNMSVESLFNTRCPGDAVKESVPISRKTLVTHLLKLSTRQFKNVDFCLPLYNVLSQMESTTSVRIRSNLPSVIQRNDDTNVTKGEAYGRVPLEDYKMVNT